MSKPLFVISCPFDTYSGYGARSRDIAKAIIETEKYDVKLLSQRWGSTSWGFCNDHPEWKFLLNYVLQTHEQKIQPDIWMQVTIPNEFQAVGKYNIGVTAGIESTVCKPEWIEGMNRMNMNWVSSKHSKSTFLKSTYEKRNQNTNQLEGNLKIEKPIHVVFEGVNLDIYKHLPTKENNFDLSNIKENFCFLFVGHWMQGEFGHDRKNVSLLVKAFYETFKNKTNPPALILKTSVGVSSYISRDEVLDKIRKIRKTVNSTRLPNIYVLNGEFSDERMNELYNHPKIKAMVSFTKGEGYGRPLAEFSLSKKPIIASNWSGHIDFLNKDYTVLIPGKLEKVHKSAANNWLMEESEWFSVHHGDAGRALKDMFSNYKKYIDLGKRQAFYLKTNFSFENMKDLISNILEANIPEFPKQVELNLPKLELPKLQKV